MQFLDEAKIYIKSGAGGAGCVSFRREANLPKGGPDGGDGGRGGSVIAECVGGLNTLIDYRYQQHFKAKTGHHGMGKQRTGGAGADTVLKLPVGTQIFEEDGYTMIADLTQVGERVILAEGGHGGKGNMQFKSSTNRAPRQSTPGGEAQAKWVWLRLKLLCDAGLLGMPNAGKSTFLATVTRAKPKIADYPFTTLKPQLGVVYVDEKEFVLADIPGLIKGASEGIGLGHRFLGHIERCGIVLHLVDGTTDVVEELVTNYKIIREELAMYSPELAAKPEIVALSKCDALNKEEIEEKIAALEIASNAKVYPLSSVTKLGTEDTLRTMLNVIETHKNSDSLAQ